MDNSLNYTSVASGVTYTLKFSTRAYTDFAEFMNPATRYEKYYTHTDIYVGDKWVFFTTDDDVPAAIDRLENPAPAHMNSRFD